MIPVIEIMVALAVPIVKVRTKLSMSGLYRLIRDCATPRLLLSSTIGPPFAAHGSLRGGMRLAIAAFGKTGHRGGVTLPTNGPRM